MKKTIILSIFLSFSFLSKAQFYPTVNALQSVFQIRLTKTSVGSSVLVSGNDSTTMYLVTCKHLFGNEIPKDNKYFPYEFFFKGKWVSTNGKLHLHPNPNIDLVAIEMPNEPWGKNIEVSIGGLNIGQEVYFLGFPLGFGMKSPEDLDRGFKLPWVKYAHVTAIDDINEVNTVFLDGMNNKGFSGGGVFAMIGGKLQLISIISGYLTDQVVENGNSGIMLTVSAVHVNELINSK